MTSETQTKRIAVIGGGITGMTAAYTLQEEFHSKGINLQIDLYENAPVLGGKILTEQIDDFTIEGGPDSFISQKPRAAELCRQIGLEESLIGTNDERRKTYVVNGGRLTPLPDGVMLIIPTRFRPFALSPLISIPGKLRMGLDLVIPGRKDTEDESLADFIRRRLGCEALDKIAEPLMSGIHVSDAEHQSIMGTFPRFRAMEAEYGSLTRAMLSQRKAPHNHSKKDEPDEGKNHKPTSLFLTLRGGLGQMVQALSHKLEHVDVHLSTPVSGITRHDPGGYELHFADRPDQFVDALILAAPTYVSASLVTDLSTHLSVLFGQIRYVSTATVSLAFRKKDLTKPLNGFGFVVPRNERGFISACTYTSIKFSQRAPEDTVLVRCFLGGPHHEGQLDWEDTELINGARKDLARLSGIECAPILERVFRWQKANPQYDVGHLQRVFAIQAACKELPGIFSAGGALEGVGIPDCISQGEAAARKALEFLG